jgi:MATE family multidrug resistance protein
MLPAAATDSSMTTNPQQIVAPAKRPVFEVWSIAWPTVLTMTSFTVMQFIDKLMVGQVGPEQVAAQGNGGSWSFVIIGTVMGVVSVVNTFVGQNLGAEKPERGSAYPWSAFWLSIAAWVLLLIPWALILPFIFAAIHHTEDVSDAASLVAMESNYAQILLFGGVFVLIGRGFAQYFFGMHRPGIVTIVTVIANIVNISANYILIFGEEGLPGFLPGIPGTPALGLTGAAIGTVVGMFVEAIGPMVVFLGPAFNKAYQTRAAWRPRWSVIRDLFHLGWPAGMQFGNEIICWAIFMTVFVGHFGTEHMAAGWIALGYMHLSFMPAVGLSVATNSIVAKYVGAGQPDVAVSRARLSMVMGMVYMSVCAAIFIVFRTQLIEFFIAGSNISAAERDSIIRIGANLLILVALFQTVDAIGIVYTGALRGAGDTVWPGVLTAIYSWVFIVGGGWVAIRWFPETESIGPWIAAAIYIILYGVTMLVRFERGRWRSIRILENDERLEAGRAAPVTVGPPASGPDGAISDLVDPP